MSAHDEGPTYALTAAFMTRVGRCGNVELTCSVANRPRSELPRVARLPFAAGAGWFGLCLAWNVTNDGWVHACCTASAGFSRVFARPIRCANAVREAGFGGCREAHVSASKKLGVCSILEEDEVPPTLAAGGGKSFM